uniref:Ovule protein n=1 Tax=Strongyloides venezuelensis TaxID=75913 RepID=A0A0K0FKM4_STRVS
MSNGDIEHKISHNLERRVKESLPLHLRKHPKTLSFSSNTLFRPFLDKPSVSLSKNNVALIIINSSKVNLSLIILSTSSFKFLPKNLLTVFLSSESPYFLSSFFQSQKYNLHCPLHGE